MLALYTTDVHGICVTRQEFDNLVDSLSEFDMARYDFSIGHIELIDEYDGQSNPIKAHTTLWAED